jgi:ribonucleoside-triphosphate reductase
MDLQDELQSRYTGGTVQHIFLGEAVPDPKAVKRFVRAICTKYRIPYFTLTPSFSICLEHGYIKGEIPQCPHCQKDTEIYSRVVGYLRPVNQWNAGKQAEFAMRQHFHLEVAR